MSAAVFILFLFIFARGRRFFVFCLVGQELDRFLKKSDKAAKGEAEEFEEDFEKHKLDEDNIGFQMLKKAG